MKLASYLICLALLGNINTGLAQDCMYCRQQNVGDIRLTGKNSDNGIAVKMCLPGYNGQYYWVNFDGDGWTNTTAKLICRQFGLPYSAATPSETKLSGVVYTITGGRCVGTENVLRECFEDVVNVTQGMIVAGVNCNCRNGEVRLTNGDTNREGRAEVCSKGRWETVCSIPQREETARVMCRQLGFPTEGAAVVNGTFGRHTETINCYDCSGNELMLNQCTPVNLTNNDYSLDVGVRCKSHDEVSSATTSSNGALGALTGILVAVLVAVVTGWILTCVLMWIKMKNSKQNYTVNNTGGPTQQIQLNNPVYDGSANEQPQTNYSSLGPAYELVDANEGAGHAYDVINQRGGRRVAHPQNTPPRSHDPSSGQDYNVLDHTGRQDRHDNQANESNQQEHDYHVLEHSNVAK